jgi:hypothetical protein
MARPRWPQRCGINQRKFENSVTFAYLMSSGVLATRPFDGVMRAIKDMDSHVHAILADGVLQHFALNDAGLAEPIKSRVAQT